MSPKNESEIVCDIARAAARIEKKLDDMCELRQANRELVQMLGDLLREDDSISWALYEKAVVLHGKHCKPDEEIGDKP